MRASRPIHAALLRFLALTTVATLLAQDASSQTHPTRKILAGERPRIAVVLSGGGARGGAHLGALKALQDLNIPVDIIVGTSAGSIIGASYASGLPLAEIEKELRQLDSATLFRDRDRDEVPFRNKADDATNYIGPEFGISSQGLLLPKGAVSGVSLEAVLRHLMRNQRSPNFDKLPIRFRAIATDLTSSEMVVLDHGPLALAVRASMAVPGAVTPVEIEGRLLVDGGLKRNLPVDVARALGADVVIAINIGTSLLKRNELTSLLRVTDQVLRILTDDNVARSLQELQPGDLLITPDLGTITSGDFRRVGEAATAGEKATLEKVEALKKLALSPADYAAWQRERFAESADAAPHIDEVRVIGTLVVDPEVVLASMDTQAGARFDPDVIDRDVKRIYGRGDFESVSYALVDEAGTKVLLTDVSEKSWGPNYLRFGLNLSSDFEGSAFFNLVASHRATWLNPLGAEWRNDLQIGHIDRLRTEWYQPLTPRQHVFVAPYFDYQREPFDLYDDSSGKRLARFRVSTARLGLDLGAPLGTWGEVRPGLQRGTAKLTDDTSLVSAADLENSADSAGVALSLRVDRLDNLRFPRQGFAGELQMFFSETGLGADDNYTRAYLSLTGASNRGPHSLRSTVRAGGNLKSGTLPAYELFSLGGFLQLSGYNTGELLGSEMRFGRVVYNYRLSGPGFFDGMYVGASMEFGRIGESTVGSGERMRRGNALYFAVDSPLGPIYIAYGRADGGRQAAYLFLGQP
jgi:NTE family protein